MRCPYCGGLNHDNAAFCVNCGRDLRRPMSAQPNRRQQPPLQSPYPPERSQPQPNPYPSASQKAPAYPPQPQATQTRPAAPQSRPPAQAATTRRQPAAAVPVQSARHEPVPAFPEAPAPFPPRTMTQLQELVSAGAQSYTVMESSPGDGKKKTVRIMYPRCANWQQVATLYKALQDQQDAQSHTIIIQGILTGKSDVYAFNNGQLQFDRNVLLGSQVNNRYVVETDNGFASDAVRFVLSE